ncbi:MAG: hypothetical protein Q8Q38_03265 [bacterium]|nr:hypothetical protein [bacterium]MDZ4231906.1 hypothetical protein [Candidatus Pacearchaeota archaeon]
MPMLFVFAAGALGGVIRGLVGFLKHQYSYKSVPFNATYFVLMMAASGLVGLVVALAVRELSSDILGSPDLTWAMALVVGYAGGDFLENVYKTIIKKDRG